MPSTTPDLSTVTCGLSSRAAGAASGAGLRPARRARSGFGQAFSKFGGIGASGSTGGASTAGGLGRRSADNRSGASGSLARAAARSRSLRDVEVNSRLRRGFGAGAASAGGGGGASPRPSNHGGASPGPAETLSGARGDGASAGTSEDSAGNAGWAAVTAPPPSRRKICCSWRATAQRPIIKNPKQAATAPAMISVLPNPNSLYGIP